MNDRDLDLALADFGATRVQPTAPPVLRHRISTMPLSRQPMEAWLPQSAKWGFQSVFSATKVVVASVIVALLGGFLLISLPFERQREHLPGAATGVPGAFSPAGSLSEARQYHTATLLPDGRVFIVGGYDEDDILASAEVWNPATASFRPAGSLARARSSHTATLLLDGRVLIVGGCCDLDGEVGQGQGVLEAEIWDPGTASFEPAGTLGEGREELHTATLLPDGRVLIHGGLRSYGVSVAETAEVWDPVTASFGPRMTLDPWRAGHTATPLQDGRVLIAGGVDPRTEQGVNRDGQVWDPQTADFEPAGPVGAGQSAHTATLLPDGRVLIVGGISVRTSRQRTSAEVWDPVTASFSPAGSLAEARSSHTAALLPDGRVLVVGGSYWDPSIEGGPIAITLAEVWDPVTASFSPAGSFADARSSNTATVLPDGRVLVVGGEDDDGVLASAEVWGP